jgi:guanylate kinase
MGSPAHGLLLVMSGPSGVGKTSIIHSMLDRLGASFSVSATTRQKSDKETDGVDYFFISKEEFQRWIDAGRFLEYAQVFGRNWYGTPREAVERQLAQGRVVVLDIDVQGAAQVKRSMPDAYFIFILPPSDEELLRRLRDRGRDDADSIERRHAEARKEIGFAHESGVYDAFVVNDDLARATNEVESLVRARIASGPASIASRRR